ncbi:MAG: nucleoside deaminase [Cytophagales bacterium]|nr:MAG: nucleoside deaminase [Cytophagales bacterium]
MAENEIYTDEYFMKIALQEAQKAFAEEEVPVGAVVVCNNKIIGKGYNQTERLVDVTAHAEMIAITAAANYLGSKYLDNCTIYVTLEPCAMCAGALNWAKISKVIFGASDAKNGFSTTNTRLLHPKTEVKSNVLKAECETLLKDFFSRLRD